MSDLSMERGKLQSDDQRALVEEIICRIGAPVSMPRGATGDTGEPAVGLRHKTADQIIHELQLVYLGGSV